MEVKNKGLFIQERNKEQKTMAKKKQTHRTQIQTQKTTSSPLYIKETKRKKVELANIINFI